MEYTTLTEADRLMIARDRLRGLESDHYRISLDAEAGDPNNPASAQAAARADQLEESIKAVKAEVTKLEKAAKAAEKE